MDKEKTGTASAVKITKELIKDNKELERYPFLTENRQFMIYITKEAAEKDNKMMNESIEPCEIIINKSLKHKEI